MARLRVLAFGCVAVVLFSACAGMQMSQTYQSTWQPMVKMNEPRPSSSVDSKTYVDRLQAYHERHQWDLNECRATATQAVSQIPQQSSVIGSAGLGALLGAATGAAIGATTGSPGTGAAIGAAGGGLIGTVHGAQTSGKEQRSQEWVFQNTYTRCMQHKGWHVQNPPKQ